MVPKLSRDTKHESNHHNLHLLGVFLAALQQRRASCSVRWVAGGRGFRGQQCVKENLRGKKSTDTKIHGPCRVNIFQLEESHQLSNPFISGVTVAGYPAFPKRAPKRAEFLSNSAVSGTWVVPPQDLWQASARKHRQKSTEGRVPGDSKWPFWDG